MPSPVDDYYVSFTKAVSRGRCVPIAQVRDGMGQGHVLGGEAVQARQMIDGVATFDDVVRKMRRNAKSITKPRASRLVQARNSLAIL